MVTGRGKVSTSAHLEGTDSSFRFNRGRTGAGRAVLVNSRHPGHRCGQLIITPGLVTKSLLLGGGGGSLHSCHRTFTHQSYPYWVPRFLGLCLHRDCRETVQSQGCRFKMEAKRLWFSPAFSYAWAFAGPSVVTAFRRNGF
jgi:hypothetical protein